MNVKRMKQLAEIMYKEIGDGSGSAELAAAVIVAIEELEEQVGLIVDRLENINATLREMR